MPTLAPHIGFVARLRFVIDGILIAITEALPDITAPSAALTAMAGWLWLHRLSENLASLVAHGAAGTLPARRPRTGLSRPAHRSNHSRLPSRLGWLVRALPNPAALIASVTELLGDAELQPLLARFPAPFGRLLRPLCRAMGLRPPAALRPATATATATARPSHQTTPAATAPVEPPPQKPPQPQSPRRASLLSSAWSRVQPPSFLNPAPPANPFGFKIA